ncbi:MAG TPA: hypothetical protein V6C97_24390 [Oculatellaceae cyanobacterium]
MISTTSSVYAIDSKSCGLCNADVTVCSGICAFPGCDARVFDSWYRIELQFGVESAGGVSILCLAATTIGAG